jgi:O-methyltransferase domain/Dimerisation domain
MQNTKPAPQEQILPIVLGFWQARALAVATELGVPDLLAEGPLRVDELASRTQTDASALFRLLRALESIGIFAQASPGVFSNTATSDCLRKDVAGSQWPTVVHCLAKGSGPFEGWDELKYAVRTGGPSVEKVYGYDFWELLRRNSQASAAMNGAMRSASVAMTPVVTAAYKWSQFPVIADIGGGIGTQLVSILDASPESKGILFDKPHLRAESIAHDRMEPISGDFFEWVPAGADAYLLRFILHDWADAEAAVILGSLRRAMKPTVRLIVVESVIPEGPAFNFGKWTDLQMLVCIGERERTETEYRALLSAAGFDLQEVVATTSPLSLLVAKPV